MTMGRPTIYSEELALSICERLANGESLLKICREDAMPARGTVFRWLMQYDDFKNKYEAAREMQAELFADELNEIADDGTNDWMESADKDGGVGYKLNGEHIQRSRLRIDTRKWIASKLKPKKYGDKITQEVTGQDGGPVQVQEIRHTIIRPSAKKDVDG